MNRLDKEIRKIKKEIKDDGETAKGDQKDAKESVCENLQKVKKKCRYYILLTSGGYKFPLLGCQVK